MIIVVLVVLGLAFGSFVNALVWRLHEQTKPVKKQAVTGKDLSVLHGRSMCPNCHHTLAWYDLLPVVSWIYLRGKCRYCNKQISAQYPTVELITAMLFVLSYYFWPVLLNGMEWLSFGVWLISIVIFMALTVYDVRWMLLPNRLVYPLIGIALTQRLIEFIVNHDAKALLFAILAAGIVGGIFHLLVYINENWIGGGDVKLGYALGLLVGTPMLGFLILFVASVIGLIVSLPLLGKGRLGLKAQIPYGPCLIAACILVKLFGSNLLAQYTTLLTV